MTATDLKAAADAPTVDPAPPEPPAEGYLSEDRIHDVLRNERRRLVLRYLRDCEGEATMRDVAERVAVREDEATDGPVDADRCQRVVVSLSHTHLPKLDEAGVVEYDRDRGVVERTPAADRLDPYLVGDAASGVTPARPAPAETGRWPLYHLAASLCGTALVAGAAFDAPVVGRAPTVAVALVAVLAVAALAVARFAKPRWRSRR